MDNKERLKQAFPYLFLTLFYMYTYAVGVDLLVRFYRPLLDQGFINYVMLGVWLTVIGSTFVLVQLKLVDAFLMKGKR